MVSNVLQALSQTLGSIYLGRLVGVYALAAVSAIFPVAFFLISFLIGLGSGSSILIGQAYGAGDHVKVKQIAGAAIALTLLLGCAVGLAGGLNAERLLMLTGTPRDILATSASYFRITFFSMPLVFFFLVYTTFLRGTGDVKTPFYVLVASTTLTMLLSPLFILGWLGLPRLETNGAAVGNIASSFLASVGMLVYLARTKNPLAFDREMLLNMRLRWDLVSKILKLGVPTSLNLTMVSLSEIAVLSFVNRFGSTATAAYGAVNQIVSYVQFPAVSIGIAASIFGAQAIGAERFDRIPKIVRSAVTLAYAIEGTLIALGYLFGVHVISLFITDPTTVALAHRLLMITLWSYAIFGHARVLSNIMLSSGAVLWPTLLSILSIWAVLVPVSYVLMQRIGIDGVWYGYPAAYVAGLLFQTIYYFGFWKRRPLRRLV